MKSTRPPVALTLLFLAYPAHAQKPTPTAAAFWNVSGPYAGSAECAKCHTVQAAHFHENSMSRALEQIDRCEILKGDIRFTFRNGSYSYSITRAGSKIVYEVTDGKQHFTAPLEYAFGQGKAGQTYVFSIDGKYYESRVSYYAKLRGLDLTVGAMNAQPTNILSAAGRAMDGNEPRNCFGCHTTGARVGTALQLNRFEEGVQCEACHGPGGEHIDAVRAGKPGGALIRSLKGMDAQQSNEFCGSCHRTWEAVMMMRLKGINTARFPSYRITGSPCFSPDDSRIACTACHNPHGPLIQDDKFYDSKCTACHNLANAAIHKKTCPVAKQACTSCHMQRVEPAESHHAFPDHWFRVVKSASDYPE